MWVKCSQINHTKGHRSSNKVCKFIDFIASNKYTVYDYRVRTLFSTKHSRTFQGLSRKHFSLFQGLQEGQNQANIMPHQMLKVESARISSQTWEASLDKIGNKFQVLSSTDRNFQGLLRPWIFVLKFKDFQGACEPYVKNVYITKEKCH